MLSGYKWLLAILALFLAAAAIVNPIGDFPLDDDFAYGRTVKNFSEGTYRIHGWISATVVFQTFIGVLMTKAFGFSFTALRFASIAMAMIGATAAYLILRELKLSDAASAFGAAALLFNPLYFNKAFNFHSDIYFLATMLMSLLFYAKAAKDNNNTGLLLLGTSFSVLALLVRQNGIFIPPAVVCYLWAARKRCRFTPTHFLIVAGIPLIAFAAYSYWFYFVHGVTESSSLMSQYDAPHTLDLLTRLMPYRLFAILIYTGLLMLPFTLRHITRIDRFLARLTASEKALFAALMLAGAASALFMARYYGKILFYLPTIIHSTGLGPAYLQGAKHPVFWTPMLTALTMLSIASGAVVIILAKPKMLKFAEALKRMFSARHDAELEQLIYIAGIFQLFFLLILLAVFDRYLLPLFFPAIVLLLKQSATITKTGMAALVIMGLFAVAGTQDYLEWNRAKDASVKSLLSQGIPADRIDGGFEHAAWHFYEYTKEHPEISNAKPSDPGWIRDYFPMIDSEYVISFSPLENHEVLDSRSYFSLLAGSQKIYTLRRA